MLEKLKNFKDDPLFFQYAGLFLGTVSGILVGFVVSDRADQFEIEAPKIEEVPVHGSEKT